VQQVLLKCCYISNRLQGVTLQKTVTFISCMVHQKENIFHHWQLCHLCNLCETKEVGGGVDSVVSISLCFIQTLTFMSSYSPSHTHTHKLMSVLQLDASCLRAGHESFNAESDYAHCSCLHIILIPQYLFKSSKCSIQWFMHNKPKLLILFFLTSYTVFFLPFKW